ncbi:NAD(P)-dependent oxidoreductase [Geobacter pickeringii]|uniref:3-hydroxyisobutyrate dehydrogenase n=1 Tax=Geobacter pickeringii TaxID=345632 RepID=A0A0B5BIE0_9BACT|nr:NAD(P)-dependent oxidoreductase [Geobacter pickeringii]AJE04275.1 3-hydroxyisobutyrate dehydrogenase [Geobacter pickeringii]
MQKFGFIGLGIMGSAMAKNLVMAGFDVTVWNRSPEKCDELVALGARQAATPREVVASAPLTFAMLADPAAAEEVCFGKNGVLEGIGDGRGYVDMSTVDPATSQRIGFAVAATGGRFLEAPVSGSKKPAEDGTLIILAAGDRTLYDEAMPGFEKMGKKVLHLGDVGRGAEMKLVVNMMMGGMMAIFCEGLALGGKAGLASDDILDVVAAGAMANPMFALKGKLMGEGNFAPAFPLKHMQKDLRLAVALGERVGQPLFAAATANELFKRASAAGFGAEDFSALFKTTAP